MPIARLRAAALAVFLSGCVSHHAPRAKKIVTNQIDLFGGAAPAVIFTERCSSGTLLSAVLRSDTGRAEEDMCDGFMAKFTFMAELRGWKVQVLPGKNFSGAHFRTDLKDPKSLLKDSSAKYRVVISHSGSLDKTNPGGPMASMSVYAYVYENETGRYVQKTYYGDRGVVNFDSQCKEMGLAVGEKAAADLFSPPSAPTPEAPKP